MFIGGFRNDSSCSFIGRKGEIKEKEKVRLQDNMDG